MNKLKQVTKTLSNDIMLVVSIFMAIIVYFGGVVLVACIAAAGVLKVIIYFGGTIRDSGYIFADFMLTYGVVSFILGWVGFRIYQTCKIKSVDE